MWKTHYVNMYSYKLIGLGDGYFLLNSFKNPGMTVILSCPHLLKVQSGDVTKYNIPMQFNLL